jgi:hypothetical protein
MVRDDSYTIEPTQAQNCTKKDLQCLIAMLSCSSLEGELRMKKTPSFNILDAEFKWVPAAKTDIRKRFRKIQAELAKQAKLEEPTVTDNVTPIKRFK